MKLRYKICGGVLLVIAGAAATLAIVLGHNSPCAPAPEYDSTTDMMKAIVYRCYGGPAVLQLENIPRPSPGDDEVLVKIHAAAVNPLDWHYMRGTPYLVRLSSGIGAPEDSSVGVDFSGTVEAVGSQVTRFKPGDAVFGGGNGAFAEYLTIRESRALTHKPDNISFEQAASVPIAALTALQALRDKGQLEPGQRVLINGASGGVGTFAVQIAKAFGAEVTGVCSTRNVDMVRSLGADHVFDYTRENYTESDQQYDLIIDNVGNHSLSSNRGVLKPEGRLVLVGASHGDWLGVLKTPLQALILSPLIDQQIFVLMARLDGEGLATLGELMQAGKIKPVLDRSFELSEVPAAIRYSEKGHARGKIIIHPVAR